MTCAHRRQYGLGGQLLPCADPRCARGTLLPRVTCTVEQRPLLSGPPAVGTSATYKRRQVSAPCSRGLTKRKPATCRALSCNEDCVTYKWEPA